MKATTLLILVWSCSVHSRLELGRNTTTASVSIIYKCVHNILLCSCYIAHAYIQCTTQVHVHVHTCILQFIYYVRVHVHVHVQSMKMRDLPLHGLIWWWRAVVRCWMRPCGWFAVLCVCVFCWSGEVAGNTAGKHLGLLTCLHGGALYNK